MKLSFSYSQSLISEDELKKLPEIIPQQEIESIPPKSKSFVLKTKEGGTIAVKTISRVPTYTRQSRAFTGIKLIVVPVKKKK